MIFALDLDWNRQPLQPSGGLYPVTVPPVAPGILHLVVKNKLINRCDEIEVTLPGDVVGLDDGNLFQFSRSPCASCEAG
ncbi:hypothetical protein SBDP1_930010 [Syntrophobacter sp. SbD1]|nr:hypothetical protein SBDP1_930010 [Syntrophobacter sp. SbD1]